MMKHYMTPFGKQILESELKELVSEARPKVIRAIEDARAHGDLSENAEYHAAKEKQSFIEGRIADINNKLAGVEVIDPTKIKLTKVAFGAKVTIEDQDTGKKVEYQIVGVDESDIKQHKISYESPLARAMLGKSKNDLVEYIVGDTEKAYEILKVKYP
jgi:transcription elongation factor GreA